jgi:hypothetical protein
MTGVELRFQRADSRCVVRGRVGKIGAEVKEGLERSGAGAELSSSGESVLKDAYAALRW